MASDHAIKRDDFWKRRVESNTESGTTLELMVGEKNYEKAKEIYEYDTIEVLELLPNLEGMDVLELGAGSGYVKIGFISYPLFLV